MQSVPDHELVMSRIFTSSFLRRAAREMSESQGVMLLSSATTEKATEAGIAMTRKTRFLTVIH